MSEKLPGRNALLRSALFYTPLFLLTLVGVIAIVTGLFRGGWLLLIISAIAALLFGYQSIQALRDLRVKGLSTTQGPVSRIWSKMDLFISRSYYINVNRNIFRIPIQAYWDLREEAKRMRADGTDQDYRIEVKVEHYPHTGNVVNVERLGVIPIEQPAASQERAG
jgi:uncharacterized protein (DUF58 family)